MPTAGEYLVPRIHRQQLNIQQDGVWKPPYTLNPMADKPYRDHNGTPPNSHHESINMNLDNVPDVETNKVCRLGTGGKICIILLVLILLATAAIGVLIPLKILQNAPATTVTMATSTASTGTTSATTTVMTVTIATTSPATTITTTSTTSETTTMPCATGYTLTPSGSCVNLLIDFNNCGSVGYVCPSTFTSCSNGVCSSSPAVLLPGAVAVPSWGGNNSIDDDYYALNIPFNISLYGYSTTSPSVTTNGVVCLSSCSNAYTNANLPTSSFQGPTALGYWDDLMIYASTSQTVYYGPTGTAPNRSMVFEFYESHYNQPSQYYHFQIIFYENNPDVVDFLYYQISDGGVSATIGVQSSSSGPWMTYSVDQANAVPVGTSATTSPTLILSFDTNAGTMTQTAG